MATLWFISFLFQFSILSGLEIAPGVKHTQYAQEGPYVIDVLEMDLTQPDLALLVWRSGGLTRSSIQAMDATRPDQEILGGINADFFSFQTTLPIGNQVTDGEFVLGVGSTRSHLLVDDSGRIHYDRISFDGYLITSSRDTLRLTGVNRHRDSSQVMFFNRHYGSRSRSDSTGTEFVFIRTESSPWRAGNAVRVVVTEKKKGYREDEQVGYMMSVGPESPLAEGFSKLNSGDTLTLFLGFDNPVYTGISQVVGGGGMILENGESVGDVNSDRERIGAAFLNNRHPRTFVATNREQTRVWLCTVDGRQESSIGMSFAEMAAFLKELGAWDAVNLDGGGSTAMIVRGKVVNRPSDPTGERAVANVLLIRRAVPADEQILR